MVKRLRTLICFSLVFVLTFFSLNSVSYASTNLYGIDYSNAYQVDSTADLDENDVIYMILTDRFADGDSTNNGVLGQEY